MSKREIPSVGGRREPNGAEKDEAAVVIASVSEPKRARREAVAAMLRACRNCRFEGSHLLDML